MVSPGTRDRIDPSCIHFVKAAHVRTRYWEAGSGDPLVLLHGGHFGSLYSLDSFSTVLDALAARFHVIAIDQLGQGHTDNPPVTRYTFQARLEHLIAVLDRLNIWNAHIVGHSRATVFAVALAATRPELVRSCILVGAYNLAGESPDFTRAQTGHWIEELTPVTRPTAEVIGLELAMQAYDPGHVTDDLVYRILEFARLPKSAEARKVMNETASRLWLPSFLNEKERLRKYLSDNGLGVPALLLWGANDHASYLPVAHSVFELLRQQSAAVSLLIMNQAGHYLFRDQPEEFVSAVTAFCQVIP